MPGWLWEVNGYWRWESRPNWVLGARLATEHKRVLVLRAPAGLALGARLATGHKRVLVLRVPAG